MAAYQEWTSADPSATSLDNPSGAAALCYPAGATTLTSDDITIPLRLTSYSGVNRKRTISSKQSIGKLTLSTNTVSNSNFIGQSKMVLPTITISGEMDSPTSTSGNYSLPSTSYPTNASNTYKLTYPDIIAACLEGRVYELNGSTKTYGVIQPNWFRDPFGRLFTGVEVRSFSAAFVEGVPGRHTFNMVLGVNHSD